VAVSLYHAFLRQALKGELNEKNSIKAQESMTSTSPRILPGILVADKNETPRYNLVKRRAMGNDSVVTERWMRCFAVFFVEFFLLDWMLVLSFEVGLVMVDIC